METKERQTASLDGGFRSEAERGVGKRIEKVFTRCPDSIEIKLQNFTKYIRRQNLTRLLALYELFKKILPVKGSIVECGVHRGFGVMTWANMSAVLEPVNLTRRIYGFDTFQGFPSISEKDKTSLADVGEGGLYANSYEELMELLSIYDNNRFLGHINKVNLIKGDAVSTIPAFFKEHPHLVVSLLFLDFDLYDPTKAAIEHFFPRIPKGGIIAFDELDNPLWPGETLALLDTVGICRLRIERLEFDPYIGYAVVE